MGRTVQYALTHPVLFIYQIFQYILDTLLSPTPPPPQAKLSRPKIAIIGAGLTGVSSASHCVSGPKSHVGGIWSKVNNTSGLQIHSIMYRFHPSVHWTKGYPDRKQIDDQGRWIVNDPSCGRFDGVIAAIGTCGEPKMPTLPGQEHFKGEIWHSSQLDGKSAKGKKVVIIGGGASAVEALEFVADSDAKHTTVLARSEKWIIPRNPIVDSLLAFNIFGSETIFSWIPEGILRLFFYRDLYDISPPRNSGKGIFTETPMVNSQILDLIRDGKATWLRGDTNGYSTSGTSLSFTQRSRGVPKNGPGHEKPIDADIVIMATGYKRPSLGFLPDEVFSEPYEPPNWYLQVFPPDHPSICTNNCTYINAIGTVGNYHIGIYKRFLLMYLVDPLARPRTWWMKRWIEMTRTIKAKAPGGAFDFFTYSELIYWFVFTIAINPFRWKWAAFVLFGIGAGLPMSVVRQEDRAREASNGTGLRSIWASDKDGKDD
ncbi:FAD/NAD(P)-binding domain-containing protein [Lizonia empirigonia]|nr:FAD/NAD(P)-binding domain-containing protein [Lizonia empirigonia]